MTLDDHNDKHNDKHNSETICCLASVQHFANLVLGLLDNSTAVELEHHAIEDRCDQCKEIWFEMTEIARGINKPTDEEIKLIIRIFTGKTWQHKEQNIINKILVNINKIQEEKNSHLVEREELINQKINTIEDTVSQLRGNQKLLRKEIASIHSTLKLIMLTIAAICLTLLFVKFLDTEYNQHFSVSPSTIAVTNSKLTSSLYEQLDSAIDNYLATSDATHMEQAEQIAQKIETNYQDKYGTDLVHYYNSLETKDFAKLEVLREEVKELQTLPFSANDSESQLAKAQKTEEKLLILGNIIEAYKIKCVIGKLYMMTSNTTYEAILNQGINYAESNNYLFLKAHFLLWKAKAESNDVDELKAKQRLEEALAISKKLQLNDTIPTITMSLAGVYQKHGENQRALIMAEDALKIPGTKHTTVISLMHIAAMASFQLSNYDKSDAYFRDAIAIAQKNNDSYYLSFSYSLAASFATEKGNFRESQQLLEKAETVATSVTNERSRMYLMLTVKGYQGKSEFKQGRYLQASLLYKESLSNLEKIDIQANLRQASELNEGLALALDKIGSKDSVYYASIARYFTRQLGTNNSQVMCVLSFLPNKCN